MVMPYFSLKCSTHARKLFWALGERRERFHDALSAQVYTNIAREQASTLIAAGC